jgi:hypothetical protein
LLRNVLHFVYGDVDKTVGFLTDQLNCYNTYVHVDYYMKYEVAWVHWDVNTECLRKSAHNLNMFVNKINGAREYSFHHMKQLLRKFFPTFLHFTALQPDRILSIARKRSSTDSTVRLQHSLWMWQKLHWRNRQTSGRAAPWT